MTKEQVKTELKKAIQKFNKKYYTSKGWYIKSFFRVNITIDLLAQREVKDLIKIKKEFEVMLKELVSDYQLIKTDNVINSFGYWETYNLEF